MAEEHNDTHHRALSLNLGREIYGTLAEIGAGQEVARWFLQVGGASGTVAKTMSAYDMTVSDDIYGKVGRYVSEERLRGMLAHEYGLLEKRLAASRGADARFFAFADTISARNFAGTNQCHGWLGLRFQTEPRGATSDIVLHINLLDGSNLLQQQAVGILGVNLIWTAYRQRDGVASFLAALLDNLKERIEVDFVALEGPAFAGVDPRAALLELVLGDYAEAVLFPVDGPPRPPSELLYKRAAAFEAGVFEQPAALNERMLEAARRALVAELGDSEREPLALYALTPRRPSETASPGSAELLARIDRLLAFGSGVLVVRGAEAWRLASYVTRHSHAPIRLVAGIATVAKILQERHYEELPGQLLEALARLFACDVRQYVYPMTADEFRTATAGTQACEWIDANHDGRIEAEEMKPHGPLSHLYAYLLESGFLRSIEP